MSCNDKHIHHECDCYHDHCEHEHYDAHCDRHDCCDKYDHRDHRDHCDCCDCCEPCDQPKHCDEYVPCYDYYDDWGDCKDCHCKCDKNYLYEEYCRMPLKKYPIQRPIVMCHYHHFLPPMMPCPVPPIDTPPYMPPTPPVAPITDCNWYVVRDCDTMVRLAQRYGLPLQALMAANPHIVDPHARLTVGDIICIPRMPATPPHTRCRTTYTARPGDTMYSIAHRYNVTVDRLMMANPQIVDPNVVIPGQKICIPC